MKGLSQELGGCGQCVKYLMFAMNLIFFILGGAIMGVGIWIVVDRNFMSAIFGTELMTAAAYMILVGGGIIFLIAFVGCLGAVMESKPLLLTYFLVLATIFLLLLVAGILAIVLRTEAKITENVRQYMREELQRSYGVDLDKRWNRIVTEAWDDAQRKLYCCSVEDQSWSLYKGSEWYKIQPGVAEVDKPLVPTSCCQRDQYWHYINLQKCQNWNQGPPTSTGGTSNNALHYRGCYTAGYDFVMEYSGYLIGMAIGVAVALILGIVFSLMLYRMI
jgi:hypothetical protein